MPSQARWLLKECLFFLLLVLNEIIIREGPEKQILSRKQNKKGLSRKTILAQRQLSLVVSGGGWEANALGLSLALPTNSSVPWANLLILPRLSFSICKVGLQLGATVRMGFTFQHTSENGDML